MSKNTRRPKQNTTPTPPTSKMKLSSSDRAAIQGLLAQRKLVTEKTAETYEFRIAGAKAKEHELPACTTSVQSKDKSQLVTDKSTLVEAVSSFEEFQTRGVGPVHAEIWRRLASLRERVVNLQGDCTKRHTLPEFAAPESTYLRGAQ
ncbi:unnamed protein product [Amoebophrya sp. A25]|nr:unnamed protein product [Amoebophrya sp. A25]|eukprot:GSA25T00014541001.1